MESFPSTPLSGRKPWGSEQNTQQSHFDEHIITGKCDFRGTDICCEVRSGVDSSFCKGWKWKYPLHVKIIPVWILQKFDREKTQRVKTRQSNMFLLWFLPCNNPHLSERDKELLTFLIYEVAEVGVPTDFCIYRWQCHYRNSPIHLMHIIIEGSQLSWKWKSPWCGGPAVLTLHAQHGADTALWPHLQQQSSSCCSDRKRISRLPYTVSAHKFCVYSPLLVKSVLGNEWALARKAWIVGCDSVKLSYQ